MRFDIRTILFTLTCFTHAFAIPIKLNPQSFEQNAARFGNKAANLMELPHIADELNAEKRTGVRYLVPAIFPLSHESVLQHLNEQLGGESIEKLWQQFVVVQKGKKLTGEGQKVLASIQEKIKNAFSAKQFELPGEEQAKLQDFFRKATEENKLLMVRSTGREDTVELANAGGNISVASVTPALGDVSTAIGEVVASYFSARSIGQRLLVKGESILSEPLFVPVLLQVMIGEVVGGAKENKDVPTSGVMFTKEAEAHAQGIIRIDATYGHNEAVVAGLAPVDTYFVGKSDIVHPVVRVKYQRMVSMPDAATGKNKLEFMKNDRALERSACLRLKTVHHLAHAGRAIEQYYDLPMDIEFVVTEQREIALVQARPIVAQKLNPSYVREEVAVQLKEKEVGETIGVGGGAVRIITSADEAIITESIGKALEQYLYHTPDQSRVQCIIIGTSAPALSHEATTFRGENKPVIYFKNYESIEGWIKDGKSVVVDVQRGIAFPFEPSEKFPDTTSIITSGWFTYPIPLIVSITPEYQKQIDAKQAAAVQPKEAHAGTPATKLVELLERGDVAQARTALQSLMHRLATTVKKEQTKEHISSELQKELKALFSHALISAYEINETLSRVEQSKDQSSEQNRLQRLYAAKFFNAILRQLPQSLEFIDNYSFGSVLKTETIEQKTAGRLQLEGQPLQEHIVQYAKAAEYAFADVTENSWHEFLQAFAALNDQELNQKLARFLLSITTLDVLPLWVNAFFPEMWAQENDPRKLITEFTASYDRDKDFLEQLQEKKQQLAAFNVARFSDPAAFKAQWKHFQELILFYFMSDEFTKQMNAAGPFALACAAAVLHTLVDTFDAAIKNTEVTLNVDNVKQMVVGYFELSKKVADLGEIKPKLEMIRTIDLYFSKVEPLLNKTTNNATELKHEPTFNVAAATITSKADWTRSIGNRQPLEDIFSLCHQNLLNMLALLSATFPPIAMPPLVESIKKEIAKLMPPIESYPRVKFMGYSLTGNTTTYYYNYPLRQHSMLIELRYTNNKPEAYLDFKFSGLNEHQRWNLIVDIARYFAYLSKMELRKPTLGPVISDNQYGYVETSVDFGFIISTASNISDLAQYIKLFDEASYIDTADQQQEIIEKILYLHSFEQLIPPGLDEAQRLGLFKGFIFNSFFHAQDHYTTLIQGIIAQGGNAQFLWQLIRCISENHEKIPKPAIYHLLTELDSTQSAPGLDVAQKIIAKQIVDLIQEIPDTDKYAVSRLLIATKNYEATIRLLPQFISDTNELIKIRAKPLLGEAAKNPQQKDINFILGLLIKDENHIDPQIVATLVNGAKKSPNEIEFLTQTFIPFLQSSDPFTRLNAISILWWSINWPIELLTRLRPYIIEALLAPATPIELFEDVRGGYRISTPSPYLMTVFSRNITREDVQAAIIATTTEMLKPLMQMNTQEILKNVRFKVFVDLSRFIPWSAIATEQKQFDVITQIFHTIFSPTSTLTAGENYRFTHFFRNNPYSDPIYAWPPAMLNQISDIWSSAEELEQFIAQTTDQLNSQTPGEALGISQEALNRAIKICEELKVTLQEQQSFDVADCDHFKLLTALVHHGKGLDIAEQIVNIITDSPIKIPQGRPKQVSVSWTFDQRKKITYSLLSFFSALVQQNIAIEKIEQYLLTFATGELVVGLGYHSNLISTKLLVHMGSKLGGFIALSSIVAGAVTTARTDLPRLIHEFNKAADVFKKMALDPSASFPDQRLFSKCEEHLREAIKKLEKTSAEELEQFIAKITDQLNSQAPGETLGISQEAVNRAIKICKELETTLKEQQSFDIADGDRFGLLTALVRHGKDLNIAEQIVNVITDSPIRISQLNRSEQHSVGSHLFFHHSSWTFDQRKKIAYSLLSFFSALVQQNIAIEKIEQYLLTFATSDFVVGLGYHSNLISTKLLVHMGSESFSALKSIIAIAVITATTDLPRLIHEFNKTADVFKKMALDPSSIAADQKRFSESEKYLRKAIEELEKMMAKQSQQQPVTPAGQPSN